MSQERSPAEVQAKAKAPRRRQSLCSPLTHHPRLSLQQPGAFVLLTYTLLDAAQDDASSSARASTWGRPRVKPANPFVTATDYSSSV
jgi:hypothetical protein